MQCTFTLSRTDHASLHRVINRRLCHLSGANAKLFISNLFIWIPLGIGVASYAALFRKYPDMSHDLMLVAVAFAVGAGLMVANAFFKQRIFHGVLLSPESWFLCEQTVALDSNGLAAKGAYGEVRYPWSSFQHLSDDNRNLYLFVDNAQALVIPKAAFGSDDQIAQIRAWLPST